MLKAEFKIHRSDLTTCYFYIVWHSWLVFIKDALEKLRIFISRTTLIIPAPLACTHKPKQTKTTTKANINTNAYTLDLNKGNTQVWCSLQTYCMQMEISSTTRSFFFLPEKQNLVHVVYMWQLEVDVGICSSTNCFSTLFFWDGVSHWTWWHFCLDWLASETLWCTCLSSPVLMSTNAFYVGTRDMNLSPHTWSVSTLLSEPYPQSLNSQLHICLSMSMDATNYEMKIFKGEKQNFNSCWHILWLGLKRLV